MWPNANENLLENLKSRATILKHRNDKLLKFIIFLAELQNINVFTIVCYVVCSLTQ